MARSAALLSMGSLDVAFKPAPVARQVVHRFAQGILRRDLRLGFVQPGLELGKQRQAVLLTAVVALFIAGILESALDAVELVDHPQRDVGASGFALRLHLLRFDEFAPGMRPAGQAFDARLRGHGVVASVVIGHQITAIAGKQAHGWLCSRICHARGDQ